MFKTVLMFFIQQVVTRVTAGTSSTVPGVWPRTATAGSLAKMAAAATSGAGPRSRERMSASRTSASTA